MRPRVYISGPLTSSGNVLENIDRAVSTARALIEAGFAPFTPHLSWHIDPGETYPHELWMDIDLPWVSAADAVLRLPGESLGADIECEHARQLGIPVVHSITALADHFAVTIPA